MTSPYSNLEIFPMDEKPTYEELARRVKELEQEKRDRNGMKGVSIHDEEWPTHKIELKKIPELDLHAIINAEEIQSIMDDFHYLTKMVTAVLDLKGNVIEATGWQDICTKFHRVNPETARNCTESDLFLAKNLKPGEYLEYQCKNGLRDVVTPLHVGATHLGNIYTGQFFYDDEPVDEDFFTQQAETYGFDKDSYMDAFRRIPKYNRETITHLMSFLAKFTSYISGISLANLQLEKEIREREKAEQALKESEAHLRTLIRTLPDLVWLKDLQGIYLSCNPRFERFFGAKEKDIIGKTDYDFVDKELADSFRMHDKVAMAEGKPSKNEEEVAFAEDGHREMLETIKTPMYDSNGRLTGVLGIGRDITDRKRAEEARRDSEAFTKAVMDNLPIGVAVHSIELPAVKFEYMNDNFFKLHRTTREKLTDPDAFWTSAYEDPKFREEIKQRVMDDYASGDPGQLHWEDVPITRKGEETSFISAQNVPVPNKPLMISTVWDVTERKQAEEALKDRERLLNEVGRIAKIGGWEMDLVTSQAKWTRGTYDIVEIEYDQPVPGPDEHIGYYLPEYQSLVSDAMEALIEEDRPLDFEAQARTAKGNVRWFHAIGRATREEGRCIKVYGTFQDITDRKQAEEEIRNLNRDLELRVQQRTMALEGADKELEDFVYSVSHDLRAPLRSISGFAQIIDRRHKASLNEEGQHYFDNIIKASRQMGELIDDLLKFSRLGRKAVQLQAVPLDDVFKTALETLSDPIEKTGAQINIPERMPVIQGDLTLATHIFINLLENAIKYHKPDEPPRIDVRFEVEDQAVIVSIADNGIGIEPAYHEKIFNIFQRLHSQEDYPGTGIGLAAVKKAVQIMGGRVWVESEPGNGSVFKIKFLTATTA